MKNLKHGIIFYSIICILFFVLEPILNISINYWISEYGTGARIAAGLFIPAVLFIFCCIGISSAIVGYYTIEKYLWKAYIPFLIVISSILIYTILPKSEHSIWYRVIKFYFF